MQNKLRIKNLTLVSPQTDEFADTASKKARPSRRPTMLFVNKPISVIFPRA